MTGQLAGSNPAALKIIAAIESSGNPAAIGDNGKARGLYQMHAGTWNDACKRLGVKWSFAEATNTTRSTIVAGDCVNHLSARFKSATGRAPNMGEVYAMWNLGFDGFRKRGFSIDKCPAITRRAVAKISAEKHITPAKPASFQRHPTAADGSVIHLAEPSGPVSFRGR